MIPTCNWLKTDYLASGMWVPNRYCIHFDSTDFVDTGYGNKMSYFLEVEIVFVSVLLRSFQEVILTRIQHNFDM